jgi:hypothetical protein
MEKLFTTEVPATAITTIILTDATLELKQLKR